MAMRCISLLAALLQVTLVASSSSASAVDVTLKQCSGGNLELTSVSLVCDGSYCSWGDRATISGEFTIASGGLSTSEPNLKATAVGLTLYNGPVEICSGSTSTTGSTCPAQGSYEFSTRETLPLRNDAWYSNISGNWLSFTLTATFDTGTTCTFDISLEKAPQYSMTQTASITGAALVFVGAIVTMAMRKRRTATINIAAEEGTTTHFEMMGTDGSSGVHV